MLRSAHLLAYLADPTGHDVSPALLLIHAPCLPQRSLLCRGTCLGRALAGLVLKDRWSGQSGRAATICPGSEAAAAELVGRYALEIEV
jgi:hypothetical protein